MVSMRPAHVQAFDASVVVQLVHVLNNPKDDPNAGSEIEPVRSLKTPDRRDNVTSRTAFGLCIDSTPEAKIASYAGPLTFGWKPECDVQVSEVLKKNGTTAKLNFKLRTQPEGDRFNVSLKTSM
jgi:hypothetical protein